MSSPQRVAGRTAASGFTLLEMLLVLLFSASLLVIGLPALQQMVHRGRLEGAARECAIMCQRARLEAITQSVPVVVRFDTTRRLIVSWLDENGDGVQDPTETEVMAVGLPGTLDFAGPGSIPAIEDINVDADGGYVTFFTDGSIDLAGSVRFGDRRDNYLQLELGPRATGKTSIQKWDPITSKWLEPREGKPWKWY